MVTAWLAPLAQFYSIMICTNVLVLCLLNFIEIFRVYKPFIEVDFSVTCVSCSASWHSHTNLGLIWPKYVKAQKMCMTENLRHFVISFALFCLFRKSIHQKLLELYIEETEKQTEEKVYRLTIYRYHTDIILFYTENCLNC